MPLNTATSIVDFLKSRGFKSAGGERFPLFNQRKSLFESQFGGEFRGTAEQNTQLLRTLSESEKRAGVSITPENLMSVVKVAQGQPQTPQLPQPSQEVTATPITAETIPTTTEPTIPAEVQSRLDQILNPLQGRDLAQEAINRFTGSATFPLEQEAVQADKEALQIKAQADTEKFIKNIASRGLIFSGAKTTGINAIEADKLSKMLGVDRSFAMLIAKGLETSAQAIAKEAQKGSQEALGALEKLGYTINPITGRIEPTLAARSAAATEQRFEETQERLERSATATEARFQQGQEATQKRFEESQAATERRFQQTQARLASEISSALKNLKANTAMAIPVTGISGPGIPQFAYYYVDELKRKTSISKAQYEELKKSSTKSTLESILSAIE